MNNPGQAAEINSARRVQPDPSASSAFSSSGLADRYDHLHVWLFMKLV
jgi:hypothetical protein